MKTINLPESKIIGITTRASNSDTGSISVLWGRFYSEGTLNKIPAKLSSEVISLYSDYEGDHTKPYNLTIGCRVGDAENIPDGMTTKTIPAGKYAVFTAKGKMPGSIVDAWQKIWNADIERTYVCDFELYGEKSADPENAEVEIYIGIKE